MTTTTSAQNMRIPLVGNNFYLKIFSLQYFLSPVLPSDSAHALFVRATYLVCHRLISSWKSDLNTSLAALELLSGLARINIAQQGQIRSKLLLNDNDPHHIGILFDNPRLLHYQQGNSVVKIIIALCQVLLSQTQLSGLANDRWVYGFQATLCISPLR